MVDREDWQPEGSPVFDDNSFDGGYAPFEYEPASRRESVSARKSKSSTKPKKIKVGATVKSKKRPAFIGSSPAMDKLREEIQIFAAEDEPVLICGETGSGKEAVAQEIHRESARANKPFVVRNISGVTPGLASSEFFGHVKGAFTGAIERREGVFELAHGGSLHLDEIGDLSIDAQSQMLRVVEDGIITPVGAVSSKEVNTRVIAATNIDLAAAVKKNKFREDLYHRLNILRIDVPPLRARGDDVIEIAEFWLAERGKTRPRAAKLTASAADKLLQHDWPGNVRELKNAVIRGAILARDGDITADHIRLDVSAGCAGGEGLNVAEGKELMALYLVAKALDQAGGNATKAAKLTEIGRTSFMNMKRQLTEEKLNTAKLAADLRSFLGIC